MPITLSNNSIYPKETPEGGFKKIVVMLHGYGSTGVDMIPLADKMGIQNAVFISPNAPQICEGYPQGFQWFSLREVESYFIKQELKVSLPILADFLASQLRRYELKYSDLYLIGFSQGAMMALYYLIAERRNLAGVVAFSGGMSKDIDMESLVTGDNKLFASNRIILIHGKDDEVVPYERSLEAHDIFTNEYGCQSECYILDELGHTVNQKGLELARKFILETSIEGVIDKG